MGYLLNTANWGGNNDNVSYLIVIRFTIPALPDLDYSKSSILLFIHSTDVIIINAALHNIIEFYLFLVTIKNLLVKRFVLRFLNLTVCVVV
jgi:hypothetical protein